MFFLYFFCGCLAQSISLGCIFPVSTADGIGWLFWFSVRFDIPFPPPLILFGSSAQVDLTPSVSKVPRIVSVMDYAKSFSLMLDLDIFSRFESFPPSHTHTFPLLLLFLFLYFSLLLLLFRFPAHFFARLPSLFAFAC